MSDFRSVFCLSDKRCLMHIIKKKLKKIDFRVRFLALKIACFFGFEKEARLSDFVNSSVR